MKNLSSALCRSFWLKNLPFTASKGECCLLFQACVDDAGVSVEEIYDFLDGVEQALSAAGFEVRAQA